MPIGLRKDNEVALRAFAGTLKVSFLAVFLYNIPARGVGQDVFLPLFVIERSQNANVVHYEAKVKDGKIDSQQPIIAYWIMATNNGKRQDLNFLERKEAYGFDAQRDTTPDTYIMKIVSDQQRPIHVFLKDGSAHAETTIGGHRAYLQKIYITTHKKFAVNVVESAELFGTDVMTGETCTEKILH